MAFRITDFKKVTRGTGEGRQLYPHQIRDERHTSAIGFAIAYYERMLGRRRGQFEADVLLEFFGDPRLARGLVACLGRSYAWRSPLFDDLFGVAGAAALAAAGFGSPAALRAGLYRLANRSYGGYIPRNERPTALNALSEEIVQIAYRDALDRACANELPTAVALASVLEQALNLDADENRLLVKLGQTPTPEEIVARYNYHSIETALVNADQLQLDLHGQVWPMVQSIHQLARRYRLSYRVGPAPLNLFDTRLDLTLTGGRDVLDGNARVGRRLNRALLRLLAVHPDSVRAGAARVNLGSKTATFKLDERALRVLGVAARALGNQAESWAEDEIERFRRAWSYAHSRGRTDGWRTRRDPEPLVAPTGLIVPDFALQRGHEQLLLCLTASRAMAESLFSDLAALGDAARPIYVLAPEYIAQSLRARPTRLITYSEQPSEAITHLVALLERSQPRASRAALPA